MKTDVRTPNLGMRVTLAVFIVTVLAGLQAGAQQTVPLEAGMVIDRSMTVRPGAYRLAASADLATPAIVVRGQNITVDFNGAVLAGAADGADPDTFTGVGLLIDGGAKVTIKNATIRGYKVGILARQSQDLHLTHNNLSYNWKQRLQSGIEKESLVDWMSYHQNERDEWLRYGAAIYLSGCDRAEIDHNTAVQGQNGLMATASTGLKIWNNTFQFLSSVGVGLYRVTRSTIMHNRIDWCVRGYSHGFYNRGQDSAGLLMYEQTSHNTVAFNSVTHGGDGLFLWAGQSTMDTGEGGANDNFFLENDFSHAPANGIEATFSRNAFVRNRIEECWHGVWGGYSYHSAWVSNRFARNTEGISIEHGHDNLIRGNTFEGEEIAIRLWQNATQDPNWGYPKQRDTKSHGYSIDGNTFRNNRAALDIRRTGEVRFLGNTFENVASSVVGDSGIDPEADAFAGAPVYPDVPRLAGGIDPMIRDGQRRGRETIIVDQWGPYDWKSPKLWPVGKPDDTPLTLRVLGPPGRWKTASVRGATVANDNGSVPGEIVVTPAGGLKAGTRTPDGTSTQGPAAAIVDYEILLEYRGAAVVSPRGAITVAGGTSTFRYGRFFVPIDWRVKLFDYTATTDPIKQPAAFAALLRTAPHKEVKTDRLDYMSGRSIEEGVGRDNVAFVAEGTAHLPPGDYTLTVISDDGVRVWMDDRAVLDEWTPHESKVDRVQIPGGVRRFKVEYYEVGGFAELRFDIQRK